MRLKEGSGEFEALSAHTFPSDWSLTVLELTHCWDSCRDCSELGCPVLLWQGWTRSPAEPVLTQTAVLQTED